jgi:hypothetical protein
MTYKVSDGNEVEVYQGFSGYNPEENPSVVIIATLDGEHDLYQVDTPDGVYPVIDLATKEINRYYQDGYGRLPSLAVFRSN